MVRPGRYAGHVIGSRSTLRITSAEGKRRARIGANLNTWWNGSHRTSATYEVKRGSRTPNEYLGNVTFAKRLRVPKASTGHSGG